jgi:hypothetical protein
MRNLLIMFVLVAVAMLIGTAPTYAMYRDGPNMYQYVQSAPVQYVDWNGAETTMPVPVPSRTASAPAGTASAPQRQYGLNVPDAVLRAGLIQTMAKMCPCFDYKEQGPNNAHIAIVDKFKPDGTKPSKDFCCCYYKSLPGCNLLMKYRDEGGKGLFPVGQDFPVQEGAAWQHIGNGNYGGYATMGVSPDLRTFSHEMIHGTFGYTNSQQPAVNTGVALVDPTRAPPYGLNQLQTMRDDSNKILDELTKDRVGCGQRPEFGKNPQGGDAATRGAMTQFDAFLRRAQEIRDNFSHRSP